MQKLDILNEETGIILDGRFVWNLHPMTFYFFQSCAMICVITYYNV